ncbi:MAG: hypothetical protein JHC40_03705 [Burkholderiales bacterium]|jgi:hypothetical protein|nr:hypothetical protein [Burkholderiales bacterium]
MNKDEAAFAKALVQTVVALLLPGGAQSGPLVGAAVDGLLASRGTSQNFDQLLREKARAISQSMVAAERAGLVNPGSGDAAVTDLTSILARVSITPALLLQFEFDTERLWKYFLEVGAPNLAEASQGRRGRLESALREIAESVLALAPELPMVRLEFMREVLRRVPPRADAMNAG